MRRIIVFGLVLLLLLQIAAAVDNFQPGHLYAKEYPRPVGITFYKTGSGFTMALSPYAEYANPQVNVAAGTSFFYKKTGESHKWTLGKTCQVIGNLKVVYRVDSKSGYKVIRDGGSRNFKVYRCPTGDNLIRIAAYPNNNAAVEETWNYEPHARDKEWDYAYIDNAVLGAATTPAYIGEPAGASAETKSAETARDGNILAKLQFSTEIQNGKLCVKTSQKNPLKHLLTLTPKPVLPTYAVSSLKPEKALTAPAGCDSWFRLTFTPGDNWDYAILKESTQEQLKIYSFRTRTTRTVDVKAAQQAATKKWQQEVTDSLQDGYFILDGENGKFSLVPLEEFFTIKFPYTRFTPLPLLLTDEHGDSLAAPGIEVFARGNQDYTYDVCNDKYHLPHGKLWVSDCTATTCTPRVQITNMELIPDQPSEKYTVTFVLGAALGPKRTSSFTLLCPEEQGTIVPTTAATGGASSGTGTAPDWTSSITQTTSPCPANGEDTCTFTYKITPKSDASDVSADICLIGFVPAVGGRPIQLVNNEPTKALRRIIDCSKLKADFKLDVIFPEGTTHARGYLYPLRKGADTAFWNEVEKQKLDKNAVKNAMAANGYEHGTLFWEGSVGLEYKQGNGGAAMSVEFKKVPAAPAAQAEMRESFNKAKLGTMTSVPLDNSGLYLTKIDASSLKNIFDKSTTKIVDDGPGINFPTIDGFSGLGAFINNYNTLDTYKLLQNKDAGTLATSVAQPVFAVAQPVFDELDKHTVYCVSNKNGFTVDADFTNCAVLLLYPTKLPAGASIGYAWASGNAKTKPSLTIKAAGLARIMVHHNNPEDKVDPKYGFWTQAEPNPKTGAFALDLYYKSADLSNDKVTASLPRGMCLSSEQGFSRLIADIKSHPNLAIGNDVEPDRFYVENTGNMIFCNNMGAAPSSSDNRKVAYLDNNHILHADARLHSLIWNDEFETGMFGSANYLLESDGAFSCTIADAATNCPSNSAYGKPLTMRYRALNPEHSWVADETEATVITLDKPTLASGEQFEKKFLAILNGDADDVGLFKAVYSGDEWSLRYRVVGVEGVLGLFKSSETLLHDMIGSDHSSAFTASYGKSIDSDNPQFVLVSATALSGLSNAAKKNIEPLLTGNSKTIFVYDANDGSWSGTNNDYKTKQVSLSGTNNDYKTKQAQSNDLSEPAMIAAARQSTDLGGSAITGFVTADSYTPATIQREQPDLVAQDPSLYQAADETECEAICKSSFFLSVDSAALSSCLEDCRAHAWPQPGVIEKTWGKFRGLFTSKPDGEDSTSEIVRLQTEQMTKDEGEVLLSAIEPRRRMIAVSGAATTLYILSDRMMGVKVALIDASNPGAVLREGSIVAVVDSDLQTLQLAYEERGRQDVSQGLDSLVNARWKIIRLVNAKSYLPALFARTNGLYILEYAGPPALSSSG